MRPLPPARLATFLIAAFTPLALLTSAPAATRTLRFEERVAAQEAIERLAYSHQIGTTRPFEEHDDRTPSRVRWRERHRDVRYEQVSVGRMVK